MVQFHLKVENVMNVAVLYANTIIEYKKKKCVGVTDLNCIYQKFDGEDYFENFIIRYSSLYFQSEN